MSSQDSGLIWAVAWRCSPKRFPGGWVFQATQALPAPPGPHLSSPGKPLPPPLTPSCISALREEHPMGKPVLTTPLTRCTSEKCDYTVHSLTQYAFTSLSSPPESGHLGPMVPGPEAGLHGVDPTLRSTGTGSLLSSEPTLPATQRSHLDQRFFTRALGFLPLCTYLSVPLRFPTWCGLESTFWSDS